MTAPVPPVSAAYAYRRARWHVQRARDRFAEIAAIHPRGRASRTGIMEGALCCVHDAIRWRDIARAARRAAVTRDDSAGGGG